MANDGRRYWGTVTPLPAPVLAMQAKMQEDAGLEGLFAPQVYGPPFVGDLENGRRRATIEDFRNFAKLTYMAEHLHHAENGADIGVRARPA